MGYGRVTGPDGWSYRFTAEDYRWAVWMIVGESGRLGWETDEGAAILWTMIQRMWMLRPLYPTYAAMVKAYSKPINERWRGIGTDAEVARRDYFLSAPVSEAPAGAKDLVRRWMDGRVPGEAYAGLVHFGAPTDEHDPAAIGPVGLPGVGTDSNVFYRMPQTTGWDGLPLRIEAPVLGGRLAAGLGAVILAIPVVVLYERWRRRRVPRRRRR